jgi:2-desacetyl-2-hydroxyethyl bacteriochlorophyllide A dehydrogenase
MRAARFLGEGRIEIVDAPMPTLALDEVLMKVAYCGLCGSDRRPYRQGFPLVPGHEVSGTVVNANGCAIAEGTRAVAYLSVYCGDCSYCRRGLTNLCLHRKGLLGWSEPWNGGYAEYMAVPARDVVPLDPAIGLDVAVLLLDTVGTAWHALRLARVTPGSRVLVMGCGPLGLGAVAGLQAFGVREYYASDLVATRRDAAAEFGACAVMPDTVAAIGDLDVIVEAVGQPALINEAIRLVAPQGTVVMLGEAWQPWQFQPTADSMLKDYSLVRSWYFPLSEFAENQRIIADGAVDAGKLISHVYDLEELGEAFRNFLSGDTRKVLARG